MFCPMTGNAITMMLDWIEIPQLFALLTIPLSVKRKPNQVSSPGYLW
jgi:hypothetical protein